LPEEGVSLWGQRVFAPQWGGTKNRTWTCGRILGLTEGTHQAKVSISTADGISAGTTIRFVVDAPDPRKQQAVQGHEKRLSDFRRRQAADKAAGRTTSLTNLPEINLPALVEILIV
jgi:hypothetical protein